MAVRELCRGRRLLRGKRLFAGDELQWIIRGHLFALGRFSRRLARMGLHSVAFRQGRIVVTRTHVDVTLDWADLDLRIRRAGLDVDPGWVPWLGRVLQFHYADSRSGDAEAESPGLPRWI